MSLKGIMVVTGMFAAVLGIGASSARADSWASPRIHEVFSDSREYFVRILPGKSFGDIIGFGGKKKGKYSSAEFYRRSADRSYRLIAQTTLLNPVAPVEVLVANSGVLMTIDNWHNSATAKSLRSTRLPASSSALMSCRTYSSARRSSAFCAAFPRSTGETVRSISGAIRRRH